MNIGIVGYGFVGKAVSQLRRVHTVNVYDPFVLGYDDEDQKYAAYGADVVFACVPTPPLDGDSEALSTKIVEDVVADWMDLRRDDAVLVIKSTIPPGTIDRLCESTGRDDIVHNPEFLSEKTAMWDFANAREVVVGGSPEVCQKVLDMYRMYYDDQECDFIATTPKAAELLKMVRNSFYATKVTFMNEIYLLCKSLGLDYDDFRTLFTSAGKHPWVAQQHTRVPGPDGQFGYGGNCLPKDSAGLVALGKECGVELTVLEAAVHRNKTFRTPVTQ